MSNDPRFYETEDNVDDRLYFDDNLETREGYVERYTDASANYDWFGTIDDGNVALIGATSQRRFRRVWIPDNQERIDAQEGRYGSGLRVSLTRRTLEEWLDMGMIKHTNGDD